MKSNKRVTVRHTEWLELKSDWDSCHPDIFIKRELIQAMVVVFRRNGYAQIDVIWDKNTLRGWLPEAAVRTNLFHNLSIS